MFQHTAARRRLLVQEKAKNGELIVSTHSRAEAAAAELGVDKILLTPVSTHSRAEAAACRIIRVVLVTLFQHTAARRRLRCHRRNRLRSLKFQHTAARRRLRPTLS